MIHGSPVRLITFDGDEIFMFSSAKLDYSYLKTQVTL